MARPTPIIIPGQGGMSLDVKQPSPAGQAVGQILGMFLGGKLGQRQEEQATQARTSDILGLLTALASKQQEVPVVPEGQAEGIAPASIQGPVAPSQDLLKAQALSKLFGRTPALTQQFGEVISKRLDPQEPALSPFEKARQIRLGTVTGESQASEAGLVADGKKGFSFTATARANELSKAKYGKLFNELTQKEAKIVMDDVAKFEGLKAGERAEATVLKKHQAQIDVIKKKGLVPTKLPAGELVSLSTFDTLDDQIKEVIDIAKNNPNFTGPIQGTYQQIKSKFVDNPEFADFNAKIGRMIETAYALSGKQISERELKMLEDRFFASAREPDKNFLVKMNSFQKWLETKRKSRITDFNKGGYYVPLEKGRIVVDQGEALEGGSRPTQGTVQEPKPKSKFKILSVE